MSNPFKRLNGAAHPFGSKLTVQGDVPIVGEPIRIHAVQFNVTLTCRCCEPNPVLIADGRRPIICPKCHAVYAVTKLRGDLLPAENQYGEILHMDVLFGRVGTATPVPPAGAAPGDTPGSDGQPS